MPFYANIILINLLKLFFFFCITLISKFSRAEIISGLCITSSLRCRVIVLTLWECLQCEPVSESRVVQGNLLAIDEVRSCYVESINKTFTRASSDSLVWKSHAGVLGVCQCDMVSGSHSQGTGLPFEGTLKPHHCVDTMGLIIPMAPLLRGCLNYRLHLVRHIRPVCLVAWRDSSVALQSSFTASAPRYPIF